MNTGFDKISVEMMHVGLTFKCCERFVTHAQWCA
jgi:hypothetical protein